ncbi:hypothetical protein HFO91_30545 [Rhizobium leguminosarum]|uniref:hypothetical protein n=1 Tax=Rhizobium leguminosarum TaxID=384 RepID=UPI001C94EAFA|nr:hypothetical protein [Rhizobium leguminosarum]MBY5453920.1 hypothetical protein [Rhizobium leguminosarum]
MTTTAIREVRIGGQQKVRLGAALVPEGSFGNDPEPQIRHFESLYLPNHAVPVYPARTVDCIVKALNSALTEERTASAADRALLGALVERIGKTEASIPEKISEFPNAEHTARIETLEKHLADAEDRIKQLEASLRASTR